ncbi:MAG: hypothetical protein DMG68_03180, partial [Acidobacteria bacterium]
MDSPELELRKWHEWLLWLAAVVLLAALLGAGGYALRRYDPRPAEHELQSQVQQLTVQLQQMKQEQAMPAMVLTRYRNSICYIYGVYHVGQPNRRPGLRARVSGTGFVVADGLIATNRHVAEPWYEDPDSEALLLRGDTPELEKLVAYFPGSPTPVTITPIILSSTNDLAVLRLESRPSGKALQPLPLAESGTPPGELVTVIGYPMGIAGMVAKSPPAVYDRLAYRHDDI